MTDQKIDKEMEREAILELLRVKRCEKDPLEFAKTYLPHLLKNGTPDFHFEIYNLVKKHRRLSLAAPRSFAKTTIVQQIYCLWLLLTKEGRDIFSISASGSLAEEQTRKIKIELETNELLKNDFTWLQWGEGKSKKWTENHITIHDLNGKIVSQMRSRGRGCQVRGFRPTEIICDDLEDDELVRSQEQREKLKSWFLSALINTIDMDQQLIVIGTILHPLALLSDIVDHKNEEFDGWETRKYKALTRGHSIWEEKWPTAKLLQKKKEIGTYAFQSEFQNEPLASDYQLFRAEWVKRYEDVPKELVKFIVIDPAISTREEADDTAICVLGVAPDNNIYELETIAGKWGVWTIYENLVRMFQKHEPLKIGIEAIAYQQVLKPIILKEAQSKGLYLPIQNITLGNYSAKQTKKQPRDKFSRALGTTHLFEQGYVHLSTEKLIEQVILFPTGDHDDMVDALVYGLHLIMKFNTKLAVFKDKSEVKMPVTNSFEIKDGIPCLAPPPGTYTTSTKSWTI